MAPNNRKNLTNMPVNRSTMQRTISDISFQLSKVEVDNQSNHDPATVSSIILPAISEAEDTKCECCGMSEECTAEYISGVRDKLLGRFMCGLCSEAVNGETEKNGGKKAEALEAHVSACVKFNRFGRTHPVLFQAEAMREMFKKSSRNKGSMSMKNKGGENKNKGGIARSSSCIPAITKDFGDRTVVN